MTREEPTVARVLRPRLEARALYDRLARWYDLLSGPSERRLSRLGLAALQAEPGQRVLEIGFGTGHAMAALARSVGTTGQVHGVDLSLGMCRIAQERVGRAGLGQRVLLQCGDGTSLPYQDAVFDVLLMSFTLELFDTPDMVTVLQECHRVLHAGGRIGIVALAQKPVDSPMVKLYKWLHNRFPAYVDCRPIWVRDALVEQGFRLVASQDRSMWGLPVTIAVAERP